MNRLVIIDGNAILHRAFHALPPLTNSHGELLNAVYGFFSMLITLIKEQKPTHLIVCFDRPAPTFRQELFVAYQQHRPEMSEELASQIEVLHEALKEAVIEIFELDGYEADDLIGTLAKQAIKKDDRRLKVEDSNLTMEDRRSNHLPPSTIEKPSSTLHHPSSSSLEVIIVSGDRDLLQLVNSHVKVLAPITGITKMVLFDEQKVEEKYGIKPSQFVDYKALIGDPSDGYPGVNGIGPKGAVSLLQKFGSFEKIYHHLGEIPPALAEKLAKDAEQAALARKLATIVTDAPITINLDKCCRTEANQEKMREVVGKLGFKSLAKRLENGGKATEGVGGSDGIEGLGKNKKEEREQMELL